ncbi:hypothetical protein [uncultured Veillonella sp.]|uniref:hypothetical protein n=1 Tax=uncultured Veillonella sp. TaxID=159268 RepID=UPI0026026C15|nr:hypothetical protein [uncultured Veillonella sp.]
MMRLDGFRIQATVLKIGDIKRIVDASTLDTKELTIAKQHQIRVLDVGTNELDSIDTNGHSIIVDLRNAPNMEQLMNEFMNNHNNSNSFVIFNYNGAPVVADFSFNIKTIDDLLSEQPDLKGLI